LGSVLRLRGGEDGGDEFFVLDAAIAADTGEGLGATGYGAVVEGVEVSMPLFVNIRL
jgi:hypothetical protein